MSTMTERKETKTIIGTERMKSSVNGNPRFRVIFADGTTAPTGVDSMIAYGIENREVRNVPVEVTFNSRGSVIYVRPIAAQTCRYCGRRIVKDGGRWVDPEATGDDIIWRETCGEHDTFTAEHEPEGSAS